MLVAAVGAALRRPLTKVPENTLKFAVGAMLLTFGVYWTAEGLGVQWAGGAAALGYLLVATVALSLAAIRWLRGRGAGGSAPVRGVAAAAWSGVCAALGLLVDDGAVAVGILLAVGLAALLASDAVLGAGGVVGWALFALVWVALAVSPAKARARRGHGSSRH